MDTENRKRSLLNQRDKNKKQIENKKLDILKLYSNNDNIFNVMSNMEDKNKFLEKIEQVVIDNNNKYNYVFNFIKMCSFPVNISNYLIKAYNLPYIVYDEKFTINKNLRTYEINNNTSELFKNLTNIQLDTAYYIDPVSNVTYELFNESMLNIFMDEVINKLPGKDLESKIKLNFFKKYKNGDRALNIAPSLSLVQIRNPNNDKTYGISDATFSEFYASYLNIYMYNRKYLANNKITNEITTYFENYIVSKFITDRDIELKQKRQIQSNLQNSNIYKLLILIKFLTRYSTPSTKKINNKIIELYNEDISNLSEYTKKYFQNLVKLYYASNPTSSINLIYFDEVFIKSITENLNNISISDMKFFEKSMMNNEQLYETLKATTSSEPIRVNEYSYIINNINDIYTKLTKVLFINDVITFIIREMDISAAWVIVNIGFEEYFKYKQAEDNKKKEEQQKRKRQEQGGTPMAGRGALLASITGRGQQRAGRGALLASITGRGQQRAGRGALLASITGRGQQRAGRGALLASITGRGQQRAGRGALLASLSGRGQQPNTGRGALLASLSGRGQQNPNTGRGALLASLSGRGEQNKQQKKRIALTNFYKSKTLNNFRLYIQNYLSRTFNLVT